MPTREKTAGRGGACRDRIRQQGSLSQEAEIPAHNRAYPGSRPGGTTRFIGGITMINNPIVSSAGGGSNQFVISDTPMEGTVLHIFSIGETETLTFDLGGPTMGGTLTGKLEDADGKEHPIISVDQVGLLNVAITFIVPNVAVKLTYKEQF